MLPPRHMVRPSSHRTHACSQSSLEPALVPRRTAKTLNNANAQCTMSTSLHQDYHQQTQPNTLVTNVIKQKFFISSQTISTRKLFFVKTYVTKQQIM